MLSDKLEDAKTKRVAIMRIKIFSENLLTVVKNLLVDIDEID